MWVHLFPPHYPFLPPAPHRDLYCTGDCSLTASTIEAIEFAGPNYQPDKQRDIDKLRLRYDEFIHHCDAQFGALLERLKRKGLLDNTMVILSSDHGESFEDGYFGHGGMFLWNQLIRIPCIISQPGVGGKRLAVNAALIDLAPTILEVFAIEKPAWMQGESLLPYMLGDKGDTDKPKYAMQLMGNGRFDKKLSKGIVAVMLGSLKLIYNAETDAAQLYDLAQDPGENHDISASNPQEVRRLKALIKKDIFHTESPQA
jgi:arylsulfatase A-like enzyme